MHRRAASARGGGDASGAVKRIDALFEIERAVNGFDADRRKAAPGELTRATHAQEPGFPCPRVLASGAKLASRGTPIPAR